MIRTGAVKWSVNNVKTKEQILTVILGALQATHFINIDSSMRMMEITLHLKDWMSAQRKTF